MQEKTIFEYFKQCVTKDYANFDGRARRKEYWGFTLISFLISLVLSLLDNLIFDVEVGSSGLLSGIFNIALIVPSFAVGARRLHDIGKSGWMQLLYLFILIGWIWLLILLFTEGDNGPNEYGQDPKNPELGNELDEIGKE
jgi:uncharacterized membrane protein YhaH (DUF805 family)